MSAPSGSTFTLSNGLADFLVSGRARGLSPKTLDWYAMIGETTFRTWWAYDALGIPAALGRDATVETSCGVCGQPIVIPMTAGRPARRGPEQLWLAERGDDLRSQFCAPTVWLCGPDDGQTWAAARQHAGGLLGLDEAASKGAADWASCAAAAHRLGQVGG